MRFKAILLNDMVLIFSSIVKELESVGNKAVFYLCDDGNIVYINTYSLKFNNPNK